MRGFGPPEIVHRWVNLAGIAFGILFVVISAKQFYNGYAFYGEYSIGQTKNEVLYGFNQPQFIRNGGENVWQPPRDRAQAMAADSWRYVLPAGSRVDIDFDPSGRAEQIACGGQTSVIGACPSAFGIELNVDEDEMIYRLGAPDREVYAGPSKTSIYSGLGLALRLEQFRVTRMVVSNTSTFGGRVQRYLRWAIP